MDLREVIRSKRGKHTTEGGGEEVANQCQRWIDGNLPVGHELIMSDDM